MNVLNAIGNIGKDAETRFTPNGDAITSFSFALTSGYGDKAVTTWVNCNYWGKRGEAVAQYLKKGTKVGITGELTNRKYTTKEGEEKYSLELRINDLTLLGSKDANSQQNNAPKRDSEPPSMEDFESDIPF